MAGQGKMAYAAIEHGGAIATMQAIKHALDPNNILNQGKMLAPAKANRLFGQGRSP
jgi:D-lactate dehydrogenase (cytochrome)